MTPYRFTLRRTFSANKMYATAQKSVDAFTGKNRGGRVKARAYKEWREAAGWQMREQGCVPAFTTPVSVALTIGTQYYSGNTIKSIPEKFDGDNCHKPITDLLVYMGVVTDDSWRMICERSDRFCPDTIGAEVVVSPLHYRLDGKGKHVRKVDT
jgi:Holliday junction resolvase RusA-like endonuclease